MNIIGKLSRIGSHLFVLTSKAAKLLTTHSRLLKRAIVLTFVASTVAACQHNDAMRTIATKPVQGAKTYRQIVCKPWKPIGYNSLQDDPLTQKGVRVHNLTGWKLRCPGWKKP